MTELLFFKKTLAFKTRSDFREWLTQNHQKEKELLVEFYKKDSGLASISWAESVEEALCFGWIDGVRKSVDDKTYTIRFSVRKPDSAWSKVNIKKVLKLIRLGKMQRAGLEAFNRRRESKSGVYSYENNGKEFSDEIKAEFKSGKKAWDFFERQAPSYRKKAIHWIMTAKEEITRKNRLHKLMSHCELERRL